MFDDFLANPGAYLPPKSSMWLWIGGPILVAVIYFLTVISRKTVDRWIREVNIWRESIGGGVDFAGYREAPRPAEMPGPPRVAHLPAEIAQALGRVSSGDPLRHFELIPGQAYLSLVEASFTEGSEHQTVTMRLDEPAPRFTVKPLPIVNGVRAPSTGLRFKKDPDFTSLFLVQGLDTKAVGRWLGRVVREAMRELPEVFVDVQGRTATVTLFGYADADRIDKLVEVADVIFAAYGAEGGRSLFGEADRDQPAAPPHKRSSNTATRADTPASKKSKEAPA